MAYRALTTSVVAFALLAGGCVGGARPGDRSAIEATPAALRQEAAPLPAPAWRVGDSWSYSDGYALRVEAAEGGLTWFRRTDAPEQWFSRRGFLRQDAQSSTAERSVVYRSVSADAGMTLVPGRPLVFTREFVSNGVTRIHNTSWVLEGRERLNVPAGDFDAYVVVMRTRNPETGWTGFERWWYAPELRHYVRMEYRYGDQPVGSRVLIGYQLADGVAERPPQYLPKVNQTANASAIVGQSSRIAPPTASQGPKGSSSAGLSLNRTRPLSP